jgi:hypothetical protein
MSRKYLKLILVVLVVMIGSLLAIQGVSAQGILSNLELTGANAALPLHESPVSVVILVIKGALGLVAIIFFVMIVVSGFKWMTAGGNEETVTKAKNNIRNAVIGLIVIIFAYMITSFVLNIILNPETTTTPPTPPAP